MADCKVFLDGGEHRVTSKFGYRIHPKKLIPLLHEGEDIVSKIWRAVTRIKPLASGTIIKLKRDVKGYSEVAGETGGNYVVLSHTDGKETWYKHLEYGSIPEYLKVGDKVYANTFIGNMGTTGLSTGVHLHVEVGNYVNGKPKRYDPEPYITGKLLIDGHDEEEDIMGYPILKDDEYVNADMAKTNTDESKASITKLQQILVHKFGYQIAIDGKWTNELDRAVRDYQTANGLGVDGRAGPATIKSLNRDLYAEIKELRKAPKPDPEQAKEIEKLKLDKAQLQNEKSQLQTEKANAVSSNVKLTADLNTANSKIDKIKTAVDIFKTL